MISSLTCTILYYLLCMRTIRSTYYILHKSRIQAVYLPAAVQGLGRITYNYKKPKFDLTSIIPSKLAAANSKLLESRPSSKTRLLQHTSSASSLEAIVPSNSSSSTSASLMAAASMTASKLVSPCKSSIQSSPVKSSRAKVYLETSKRHPSFDSSGSSSSSSISEASSSAASTPSLNNLETLAKQVANLEYELKHKNEKLETATERLSDRELEISILQKRLELRSARLKNELAKEKCTGCTKKDGLISSLFEKVNLYESAILGR